MKPRVKLYVLDDLGTILHGIVWNHPNWPNELHRVATSVIYKRHADGTVETENTIYEVYPRV